MPYGLRVHGRGGRSVRAFLTPGVDGGRQKTYDGDVLRSERANRSDVWARVRLHGEPRRVGCVRTLRGLVCSLSRSLTVLYVKGDNLAMSFYVVFPLEVHYGV